MRILICSDGSEQAEQAVRLGALIAAACQPDITLLGISESPGQTEQLLNSLKRGQALLVDKKISAELITKAGDPLTEIVKRTQEAHYDLVIIGAVRKASRGLFWMSSKSYKIVKEIGPPVLIVAGKATSIQRMLICAGGKRYIEPAVRLAGDLARCLGAQVTLLHVMAETPAIYARLPRIEETAEWLLNSTSELGLNLRQEKGLLDSLGVRNELRLRRGPVLEQILSEIREGKHDLVVTGSALNSTFRTYIMGDVTRELVNRASCAVLVVRSGS